MKNKIIRIPRILRINEIDGLRISVLFNNGQDRIIDFENVFKILNISRQSIEHKLLNPLEFKKVKLNNYTLSWDNAKIIIETKDKKLELPYEIGADVLYKWSEPDNKREELQIGNMLKNLRIKEGLTQDEVALLSGTSRTYISRIENNQSDIELFTLQKIVKAGFNKKLKIEII